MIKPTLSLTNQSLCVLNKISNPLVTVGPIELAESGGSRSTGLVQGRGTAKVWVQSLDGRSREVNLENALYIPSYQQDIFSVQAATEKRATVNFSPHSAELVAPNGTIFDIRKSGKL